MFYYVSFLRPPPLVANPSEPILITPQICNDLRTEYLSDPVDLYYAWLDDATGTRTPPAKLTAWRPGGAYKAIPVPPPPPSRQEWRLVLTCSPSQAHVSLAAPASHPLPVTSMPIRFTRNAPKRPPKQERIIRSYTLPGDPPITFDLVEQTSFDLDKKVWDSGLGLGAFLVQLARSDAHPELHEALFSPSAHILELGAGTGIVALVLALLRPHDATGTLLVTDLPSAMPILETNLAQTRAQAAVLDWDDSVLPPQLDANLDAIVMADVAYNTASFSALVGTLDRVIRRANGRPKVLMGYKQRHPDERALWERAREIGLAFRRIACVDGAGGCPVEIWLA